MEDFGQRSENDLFFLRITGAAILRIDQRGGMGWRIKKRKIILEVIAIIRVLDQISRS